nr:pro neuregulin 2 membrane bound [Hymenolepis microstoma]
MGARNHPRSLPYKSPELETMVSHVCHSIYGKNSQSLKCGPELDTPEIHQFLASSPIVLHARIQEMVPAKGHEFDLIVLITQIVIKPDNMDIPKRVILRRFFLPANGSSSNPYSDKFGCLEVFKPYAKYTFLLADTGETITHRGNQLVVLALSGPTLAFSEKINQDIQKFLCKSCYPPKLNSFEKTTMNFGDKISTTCIAEGDPLPEIYWYKDKYPVDVVNSGYSVSVDVVQTNEHVVQAILEIDNLILLDNGDYICKAKNSLGIAESIFPLRVRKPELPHRDEEHVMDTRDLEPCDPGENHCFNDGLCFFKKSDRSSILCSCKEGYMGDQCQFRTTGIFSSTSPKKQTDHFWLQVILQFIYISIFALIVIGVILAFRRKDHQARQKRRILAENGILYKSQYVQVNTIEPPPPPIKSPDSKRKIPLSKSQYFSVIPQTPHYARLENVFTFDTYGLTGNGILPSDSPQTCRTRITTLPQSQKASYSIGLLEPIVEREPDSSPINQNQGDECV